MSKHWLDWPVSVEKCHWTTQTIVRWIFPQMVEWEDEICSLLGHVDLADVMNPSQKNKSFPIIYLILETKRLMRQN